MYDLRLFSPEAAPETVKQALAPTTSRGPDAMKIQKVEGGIVGFQRLSIMGLTHSGMQPFSYQGNWIVCNGEIYGFRSIKRRLEENGIRFESDSDCEILLPLYEELGCDMFKELDAEFACILVDTKHHHVIAARDPIGIRPLYYGYDQHGDIVFASEPKNLVALVQKIFPFPPGHYYKDGHFVCYRDLSQVDTIRHASLEILAHSCGNIWWMVSKTTGCRCSDRIFMSGGWILHWFVPSVQSF